MKKLIAAVLFTSGLFASQIIELAGDMNYPPYSYKKDGQAQGVYVDIIKIAFNKMPQYDVEFKMTAYKRAIALTKKGKVVGFFPPYYSKERTSWTKFSEPILGETTIVFAKKDTLKNKTKYPEDFIGNTVCLNRGFNQALLGGFKLKQMIKNKKIRLIEANSNKDCLVRVKRGMADFYINDQLIDISHFPSIKKGMKVKANFGHVGFTLKTKKYPFINDLQQKFNTAIKQMKSDGTIYTILQKYK